MKINRYLALATLVLSTTAFAQETASIYPFKPYETDKIRSRVEALTEGTNYLWNIHDMEKRQLSKANTSSQPWGGSFWPLNKGMIANNFHDFADRIDISWKQNAKQFDKRAEKLHPKFMEMSQKELDTLAPSEKYDVLLGDTSFELTNKIWHYSRTWAGQKKWGFLSKIDMPEGYRTPKASDRLALWEGICHGWAVASGVSPRPEKTVNVKLPNGKNLPFSPEDIKALISVTWAHSLIQDHILFEGSRCNKSFPKRDNFGRYIDTEIDKNDTSLQPRCADTHPAIFHITMLNILGLEGRSFVIDHKAEGPIANQPVSGYEFKYFHPESGKEGTLEKSMVSRASLGDKDNFKSARNAEATHIVGINMTVKYVNWAEPSKKKTNSPSDDKIIDMEFNYDLEINAQGNIVGGQWRIRKNGDGFLLKKPNIPDFFWIVPRDYKKFFQPVAGLPEWNFETSNLPPKEYLGAARNAHNFMYEQSEYYMGVSPKCPVFPINGGEPLSVNCEFRYPRPQPLLQVVNKLLEISRK